MNQKLFSEKSEFNSGNQFKQGKKEPFCRLLAVFLGAAWILNYFYCPNNRYMKAIADR